MTEETKSFIIKCLVVAALVGGMYYAFSPYQNCLRESFGGMSYCERTTSW